MTTVVNREDSRASSPSSLTVTAVVAVTAVIAGWLIGAAITNSTSTVTAAGLTIELPPDWVVLEETETEVIIGPAGFNVDQRIVIYLPSSREATGGVETFLATAPDRFLVFTIDASDDQQATFRYVGVDQRGGPKELLGGQFRVVDNNRAAAVFTALDDLDDAISRMGEIVGSIRESG